MSKLDELKVKLGIINEEVENNDEPKDYDVVVVSRKMNDGTEVVVSVDAVDASDGELTVKMDGTITCRPSEKQDKIDQLRDN
jgi:hypothetical protein